MKNLILICIACLTPLVSFSQEVATEPLGDTARPSASVALVVALDSVLDVVPDSDIEFLGADSQIVEATEAKAAHAVVELKLLVRAEGGAKAESDFGMLEKALAKRASEPHAEVASYDLFKRTLVRLQGEAKASSSAAGSEALSGSHRGTLRVEFALGAIPSYQQRGSKEGRARSASGDGLVTYIRSIAQGPKVQFGKLHVKPTTTPVTGGNRYSAVVTRPKPTRGIESASPMDFHRISNLLYLLDTKSASAVVTSIELGPLVKGAAETFEFQLSTYE